MNKYILGIESKHWEWISEVNQPNCLPSDVRSHCKIGRVRSTTYALLERQLYMRKSFIPVSYYYFAMDWNVICFNTATFIAAVVLLDIGADKFVDHTAIIARRFGVSATLIALLTAGAEWEEVSKRILVTLAYIPF